MKRWLLLATAEAIVFAATVMILSRVIPGPHTPTDYLIVGTTATLVALAAAYAALRKGA
jgi:hypothetical protein